MERKVKLQITGMEKKYKNGDGVENINIDVHEGEFVTMLGPSGCGKSTILRTLGGFLDIDKGDILIDGQSVKDLPPEKRPTAMVFQSYNLWPHMTVYENLAFGLEIKKVPKNVIRSEIERGLKLVNMSGYEKKYPGQLSGGQQQRIAIARALLLKPSVLLLDEPFSALDAKIRAQMREELKRIQEELNITVVFVTHDQEEAMALSHRIVVMNLSLIHISGHTGPAAADGLCQGLGGLRRGFWSVVPVCLNKCGKNSVQVHGAVEIQAADRGDGKAGAGQPDPPLDGLAVIGDHGRGVVYDLNEIHEPGIVNGHIPAHTIGKGRGQGKGMGRPCLLYTSLRPASKPLRPYRCYYSSVSEP